MLIAVIAVLIVTFLVSGCCLINSSIRKDVAKRTAALNLERTTSITITINGKVLNGYLYDTPPARSFQKLLPLSVSMSDWGHDFCGGKLNVEYQNADVQTGFRNGDIAFWTPRQQLAFFVSGEDSCLIFLYTKNVILGHINESQETLDNLNGNFDVTIELKR